MKLFLLFCCIISKNSILFIIFKFYFLILQHAKNNKYVYLFQNTPRNNERELDKNWAHSLTKAIFHNPRFSILPSSTPGFLFSQRTEGKHFEQICLALATALNIFLLRTEHFCCKTPDQALISIFVQVYGLTGFLLVIPRRLTKLKRSSSYQ